MKKFVVLSFLVCASCVTPSSVKPEDSQIISQYSCDDLEKKLVQYGAMRDNSENNQNLGSGKHIAANIVSNVLTLGMAGAVAGAGSHMNAAGNEKKYKKLIESYYVTWDRKKCSKMIYDRNQSTLQNY